MSRRIPPEAFSHYVSLGPGRSYQAVAEHFGVSKRAIVARAKAEDWQERLRRIETEVRDRVDQRTVETLEEMAERHLKILRVIQTKAVQALKAMEIESAMDAVRALDIAVKAERIVRGEPGDRTELSFQEIAKQQHERWLSAREDDEPVSGASQPRRNGGLS